VKLAEATRAGDLDRQLHGWDFIILLNREEWLGAEFSRAQMLSLVDHELCHCAARLDKYGEQVQDSEGRGSWRIRRHDVEEFVEVVRRHGLWKADLEQFARAAGRKE